MNFLDELILSFVTILFTLLIVKFASASTSGDGSRTASQSVELKVLDSKKVKVANFDKAVLHLVKSDSVVNELPENDQVCKKNCNFELLEEESTLAEETDKELELREIEIKEVEDIARKFENEFDVDRNVDEHVKVGENVVQLSNLVVEVEGKIAVKEINNVLDEHVSMGEDVTELSKLKTEDEDKLAIKGFYNELDEHVSVGGNITDLSKIEVECGNKLEIKEFGKELDKHVSADENVIERSNCEVGYKYGDEDKLKVEELEKELSEPVKTVKDVAEFEVKICEDDDVLEETKDVEIEEKSSIDENISLLQGEDEWEGIEKSELEMQFGAAVEYVGSEDGGIALENLSSDVKKQLYGLHKLATEGPCYEPQPLALKVAARSRWHSWQKLGNMNPEVAMEQYIAILYENIPGWTGEKPGVEAKLGMGDDTPDAKTFRTHESSVLHGQPASSGSQRVVNDPSFTEAVRPTSSPSRFAEGLTSTFLFDLLSPSRVTFFQIMHYLI